MAQNQALVTQEGTATTSIPDRTAMETLPSAVVAAAEAPMARLQGRVWEDLNADELLDDAERGIGGATVQLVRDIDGNGLITADEVVSTAVTDANGIYSFGNLTPGEGYQLRFVTPSGYDASVSSQLFDPVTLQAGDNGNADIGFFKYATLGNRVWNDVNGNGVQDTGETGRSGVKVELYTAFRGNVGEGGGALGSETVVPGDLVATQLTDADGNYSFDSVVPGEYMVRFVAPDGTVLSTANVGVNDAADSDADKATGFTGGYLLASGDTNTSVDAGVVSLAPPPASLSGQVWHDINADELTDTGELGIAGATVELVRDLDGNGEIGDGEVVATALTDANGNYRFDNLTPGVAFQVRFLTPEGYDATSSSPLTEPIVLQPGQNADVGIGFFQFASLGNRVWNDANANGLQDAGETGRAGVTVELYTAFRGNVGEGGGALGSETVVPGDLVATQQTDANGNYSFDRVVPGEYMLRFVAPDGTVLSTANVGVDDSADSDANATTGFTGVYTLTSNQHDDSADAGVQPEKTTAVGDFTRVCEDRSVTFNVLANDSGVGLKLVKVAHASASLDTTFKSKAGAISFTADGQVTYKSMANYYGFDQLIYTLEDASGKQFSQTVLIQVDAVSDAPTVKGGGQTYHWDANGGAQFYGKFDGKTSWVHNYSVKEFGTFDDSADALQDFGGYNRTAAVGNDTDSLKVIRLYGLSKGAEYGTVLFDGQPIDFSNGKTFDVTLEDIQAGRLDLRLIKAYTNVKLDWTYVDTGSVQSTDAACQGSVESLKTATTIWTPVALDLNGDGQIGVTGATSSSQKDADAELGRTVQFDIDANGKLDTIEWFDGSGDGILVDNRDGLAATQMNGSRLFGADGGAFADGYDKLATLDANADGILSGEELQGLLVWVDNGDAQVQQGELRTLGELGIASISTRMNVTVDDEGRGHLQSTATREDGTQLMSEDVFFASPDDAAGLEDVLSSGSSALDALVGAGSASTTSAAVADEIDAAGWAQSADVMRKIAQALQAEAIAG